VRDSIMSVTSGARGIYLFEATGRVETTKRAAGRLTLAVAQLEERFASRYGNLTKRERQVCARAALGMSVEATALDLGSGKTSVLTYRQRAYLRL